MTSSIIYQGDLRTEMTHTKSGQKVITDAPTDNHGKGEAFSPTDLVATALGSCAVTIMGIAADNHDIDIVGTRLEVTKTMASDPRRIEKAEVVIYMPDNNYSDKEKKILTAAALGCPVMATLKPGVGKIDIVWHQ